MPISRWREVVLVIASAGLAAFACEWLARAYLPEVRDTFVIQLATATEKYHHPLQGAALMEAPQPDAFRIMFVGDSFTWGICDGVAEQDGAYPPLFEKALERSLEAAGEPMKIQVFTVATPSYSPSIYGALLRDFAPRLHPHLVVLAVDDSDVQDDYLYRRFVEADDDGLPISVYPGMPGVPGALIPLARRSKLVRLAFAAAQEKGWLAANAKPNAASDEIADIHNRLGHYQPGSEATWADAMTHTMSLVSAFVRYCKRNGIDLMMLNYPYVPAVTKEYCPEWRKQFGFEDVVVPAPAFHAMQRAFAEKEAVSYYDFTTDLRAQQDHAGLYCELDGHFTPKANAMLAERLVEHCQPLVRAIIQSGRGPHTADGPQHATAN